MIHSGDVSGPHQEAKRLRSVSVKVILLGPALSSVWQQGPLNFAASCLAHSLSKIAIAISPLPQPPKCPRLPRRAPIDPPHILSVPEQPRHQRVPHKRSSDQL